MSNHPTLPLATMRAAAERLVVELAPFCERIEIAGSIRRGVPMVADIEIVCQPHVTTRMSDPNLLGERVALGVVNPLDEYCRTQLGEGRYQHRLSVADTPAFGTRYKRMLVDGIPVDLFSVLPPAQFAVIFLIRTGNARFSRRIVTVKRYGGYLPDDCKVREGSVYRHGRVVELADEAAFFALCDLRYVDPEFRR